ncbi:MAG: hypothetical protein IJE01_01820 [Clostridia bacterium]|nr:hypothetical protein [Clostridia bacterium]
MSLKDSIKKIPIVYPVLSYIKNEVFLPIKSGHMRFFVYFILFIMYDETKALKSRGFKNIHIFMPFTWRIGKGRDYAFRRYYTACLNGIKVFIKIGKNDSTVVNEAKIYNYIGKEKFNFLANAVFIDHNFADDTVMIANEFIEGLDSVEKISQKSDFENICQAFLIALDELEKLEIIHADIHKGNIMYAQNKGLYLLDFGISFIKGKEKTVNYSARPGTFYINDLQNKQRKYDDAYSFTRMIECLKFPEEWLQTEAYIKITERIGNFSDVVEL